MCNMRIKGGNLCMKTTATQLQKKTRTKETKKGRNHLWVLRLKAGYDNVSETSKKLGISKSTIYEIEKGTRKPSSKLATRMADLYKCSLDAIYNRKNTCGVKANGKN